MTCRGVLTAVPGRMASGAEVLVSAISGPPGVRALLARSALAATTQIGSSVAGPAVRGHLVIGRSGYAPTGTSVATASLGSCVFWHTLGRDMPPRGAQIGTGGRRPKR